MTERKRVPDDYKMPMGKYKGESIGTVPAYYLDWLMDQEWIDDYPLIKRYIRENQEHIDKELE